MTPEEQSPEVRELLVSIRRGHAYTFHVLALFAIPLAAAAGFLVLPQPFGALSVGLAFIIAGASGLYARRVAIGIRHRSDRVSLWIVGPALVAAGALLIWVALTASPPRP